MDILRVVLVVDVFLWLLTLLPVPALEPYGRASGWLAWFAVVILTAIVLGVHA